MRGSPINPAEFIGKKYNKLTLIEYLGRLKADHHHYYRCMCECGNESIATLYKMRTGHTKACGCLIGKMHGVFNHRLYRIWASMKTRCHNPNAAAYKSYGGRGIYVCDEWRNSYKLFYRWSMDNGYKDSLSIDRKENSKGYNPSNCRWVTMKQQQNNKTNNVFITFNGETHTIAEWSEIIDVRQQTISARYKNGWPLNMVLSKKNFKQAKRIISFESV